LLDRRALAPMPGRFGRELGHCSAPRRQIAGPEFDIVPDRIGRNRPRRQAARAPVLPPPEMARHGILGQCRSYPVYRAIGPTADARTGRDGEDGAAG